MGRKTVGKAGRHEIPVTGYDPDPDCIAHCWKNRTAPYAGNCWRRSRCKRKVSAVVCGGLMHEAEERSCAAVRRIEPSVSEWAGFHLGVKSLASVQRHGIWTQHFPWIYGMRMHSL